MSNDSLSAQAQYLIDVDTKVSEGNMKRMFALMEGLEVLFNKASGAAKKAAEDFKLKGSDENLIKLQAAVGVLGKSMRDLNTSGKNVSLLSDNEVTRVLALKSEVEKLEKALKQIAQNSSIKAGTLGLDSGDIQQKVKDLKALEAAQRANALALDAANKAGKDDGAKGVKQYQDRAALIQENIRLIKLQTQALQEAENAKKGSQLNEDGERQYRYKQVLSDEKTQLLKLTEERRQYLAQQEAQAKAARDQEKAAKKLDQLNEEGQRQYQYKQVLADDKKQLLNQMEQRRQYLRDKTLAENQQAKEYLSFQPNQALKQAFGNTNAEGANTFQKVNLVNSVPAEQIAAQKQVLALQEQLVERMRQGLPIDRDHLALVEQVINAKRAENAINQQNLQQIRETEAGQRRIALASGVGAASLLAIQSAIRANGLVLNGLQNAFSQALTSAINVEAEFKNVQAVTATTNTEMKGLEETIRKVAGSTKFSASEVGEAALILGQAGLSARETSEAIPAVALLATAAGTSLAQAVSLTTSVLGIFDKQASETADIANKITQAANSSKVSVEKLAVGFQYAGNIAHQLGISFEETTAAMAAMSNAGILNGSTLGSGLRSFLTEVQKPSAEFITSLTRIGLSLSDVDFKAHGLLNVTRTLREAGFVATDAIKSFDIRGAAAFNSLVANPDDLERQYKSLLDTSAAINANAIQMDSLQAQSKRLQTSLENLTGVGFGPLGTLLKDTASGMATLIQHASEATGVVGFLGTALAVTAAVGTARFAISIAAGALQLANFEAATVASVRALGTMTIASSGASLYGLLSTSVTAVATSFQTLTFTSAGAAAGLRGVAAAIGGLSLLTGIGIAVAAIAAGYYALTYASESAKRAIDESTAAANNAKATFDAKAKTIDNLDETIKSLTYRQNTLKDGTAELRLATAEANNKFGDQIKVMDVNTTTASTLIETLRKLRNEMNGLATLDLDNAVQAANKLQKATGKDATQRVTDLDYAGGISPRNRPSTVLQRIASDNAGALKAAGINPDKLVSAAGAIQSGDRSNQDLSSLLTLLPQVLKNTSIKLDPQERGRLEALLVALPEATKALSDSRHADNGAQELTSLVKRRAGVAALRAKPGPNGGTIGDSIATQPALIDKLREDNPDVDSVQIFELADAAIKKLNVANKGLIEYIKKISPKGDTAASDVIQQITSSMGDLNRQRDMALKGSESLAKRRDTEQTGVYTQQLRVLKKQPKTPERDAQIRALESSNTDRKFAFQTRGITDEDQLAEAKSASDQAAAARADADTMSSKKAPRSQTNSIAERAAKLDERAELAQANSDKALAGMLDDFDAVEALLQSGKRHIVKAGEAAQRGLKAQQAGKRDQSKAAGEYDPSVEKTFAAERDDLDLTFQANLDSFVGQFGALKAAGGRKVQQLQDSVKRTVLSISNMKLDADESLYQAGGRLREIQTQQATRQYPNSIGPNGTFEQESNVEKLKIAQLAIKLNADLLEKLGDEKTGLIGDQTEILARVTSQVEAISPRIKFLKDQLTNMKDGDPNRTTYQTELKVLAPQLETLQKEGLSASTTLKGFRGDKRTAQNQAQSLGIDAEEIKQKIPVEFTFENLTKTLENGVNEWRQASGNLDSIKTLSDSMATQIGSYTSSVSAGFKSMLDGTKSVKEGFKSMAASVISTMLDMAAQLLAQQAIKGIVGLLGSFFGGAAGGSGSSFGDSGAVSAEYGAGFSTTAATGGYINSKGSIERVQRFARGGPVMGGIAGRDSVPALLMPNEFVMNTKAVDAVGTDFLHSLNSTNNSMAASGAASRPKTASGAVDNTVNVWVVSPDQQPTMGPKDIIAVIGDDIVRGGTTKKLIKSIQMGQ